MTAEHGKRNRSLIYAAASLRSAATGLSGVMVGIYLARLHLGAGTIGAIITAGLAGGAGAALLATVAADNLGRRRFLFSLALMSSLGGLVLAAGGHTLLLAGAAFFGMLNGMGKDRGAPVAIEQAILPSTAPDEQRTSVFAFYNVVQSASAAVGALLAGLPDLIHRSDPAIPEVEALRAAMLLYAALMGATALLYIGITREVEIYSPPVGMRISPETRAVLVKLSALFALDSVGGGFLTQALISLFFVERFGVGAATVAALFFCASIANALSQLVAPILARRIGLINTMVFTHLPSNALLMMVAIAPNFPLAAALFLVRESMVQMDVPARQSYVMAVVRPEERTFAAGVTGLVRLGGWAVAPGLAGILMQSVSLGTPLIVGPALKAVYDILLFRSFRHLKPPEERIHEAAPEEPARKAQS
jgi:MFS family permease